MFIENYLENSDKQTTPPETAQSPNLLITTFSIYGMSLFLCFTLLFLSLLAYRGSYFTNRWTVCLLPPNFSIYLLEATVLKTFSQLLFQPLAHHVPLFVTVYPCLTSFCLSGLTSCCVLLFDTCMHLGNKFPFFEVSAVFQINMCCTHLKKKSVF